MLGLGDSHGCRVCIRRLLRLLALGAMIRGRYRLATDRGIQVGVLVVVARACWVQVQGLVSVLFDGCFNCLRSALLALALVNSHLCGLLGGNIFA